MTDRNQTFQNGKVFTHFDVQRGSANRQTSFLGRGNVWILLPQVAALPGSDAGSDVVKPVSSFIIQNRQMFCSMWCPTAFCSMAPHSQFGERARPHLYIDKWNRPIPVCKQLVLAQAVRASSFQQAWHGSWV